MDRKNELLIRAYLVLLAFVILSAVILVRVVKVSVIEGEKWRKLSGVNVKMMPVYADRGNIYAEDGSLLATSLPFFEIRMDLMVPSQERFDNGIDSLSYYLSKHIDNSKSPREWKSQLSEVRKNGIEFKKPGSRYHLIAKRIDFDQLKMLKEFPILRYGRYGGGLIIEKHNKRDKPYKMLASRTIGVDRENADKIGLEGYFDNFLKGDTDEKLMKRIPGDIWIPVFDPTEIEEKQGDDVHTNIDIHIQDIVHEELVEAVDSFHAEAGTAIVMDVKTGAIKAISNISRNEKGLIGESYNYAVGHRSEPGSTIKLATVMALMDDGHADLNTKVDLFGGRKKFYDLVMEDSHIHGTRITDVQKAFEISSNVGMASLAKQFYGKKEDRKNFIAKLHQFGLHKPTGVEIKGERDPLIKDPAAKDWYGTTIPWMAHGYELMLTPLQVLAFYNAVANDGVYMKPQIVRKISQIEKTKKVFKPKRRKDKIAKTSTIEKAQFLLKSVVERGTGRSFQSNVVPFSGKTGTTSVDYVKGKEKKSYNASFAGYFPSDDPVYSMIVVIYKPQNAYYGSVVAGPVFKNIAEKIFVLKDQFNNTINDNDDLLVNNDLPSHHAGFAPDFKRVFGYVGMGYEKKTKSSWVKIDPSEEEVEIKKNEIKKKKVPDVRGMGLRDALYVLENLGLEVEANGFGKVKKQSLKPGARIEGQKINIYLN